MESAPKNLGGRPQLYEDKKLRKIFVITPEALELLNRRAAAIGITRSEVVERLARGLLSKTTQIEFSEEELKLIRKALRLQIALLQDELGGRGVFSNPEITRRDPAILHQKLETLNLTLEKVKIRIRDFLQSSVQSY